MTKPPRLHCPYTLRLLAELPELSREHIIPDALGGPNGYSVQACRATNSRFGENHDAAFLNDPYIAMFRSRYEVKARSGAARWKMAGETVNEGRPVQVTCSGTTVDVYHQKPLDVLEDENGKGYRIVAPSPQADEVLAQLQKGLAKKGISTSKPLIEKEEQQTIHVQMKIDLNVLQAGLMKIAYLATFDFLGDAFLEDPLNPEWQKAIRVTNVDEAKAVRIRGACFDDNPKLFDCLIPKLAPHEHGISVVHLNQAGPVVAVQLFGNPFLTTLAHVSDTNTFGLQEGDGLVTVVDAVTGQMRQEPWMDHFLRMAQDPTKQAMFAVEVPEPNE